MMLDLAADFKQALVPSDSAEEDAMRFSVFLGILGVAVACGKVVGATDAAVCMPNQCVLPDCAAEVW